MPSSPTLVAALLALPLFAAAVPTNGRRPTDWCYRGAYMIIAHGSTEVGKGSLGSITDAIAPEIPDSWTNAINYPATLDNYTNSEGLGVQRMKGKIRNYVDNCKKEAKIVLLGYSQGAQVISDALSGGSFSGQGRGSHVYSTPLEHKYAKHIHSVMLFGDPSWTVGLPWDAGTSTTSGLIPRNADQIRELQKYKDRMISYCDHLDPYCASGKKNKLGLEIHGDYFKNYGTEAGAWIIKKWYKLQD